MLKKCVSIVLIVTFATSSVSVGLNFALLQLESVTVTISTKPSGADIYIDGGYIGTSPIKGKRISIGKHLVLVKKEPDYNAWEGEIEIVAGENVIDIPPLTIKTDKEPQVQQKPWYKKWWIYGLGAAVVGGLIIGLSGGGGNGGNGGPTPLPLPPSPPGN